MNTPPNDPQKCPSCDALVDPALLADVVFHFFDAACATGAERREELEGIRRAEGGRRCVNVRVYDLLPFIKTADLSSIFVRHCAHHSSAPITKTHVVIF